MDENVKSQSGLPKIWMFLVLVLSIAGGAIGAAGFEAVSDRQKSGGDESAQRGGGSSVITEAPRPSKSKEEGSKGKSVAAAGDLTAGDIYDQVSPAVVHVTASITVADGFFGMQKGESSGSGFVIDKEGHIVTNAHVVDGAEDEGGVKVSFSDDSEYDAVVVGRDVSTDLAVLKVDVEKNKLEKALKPVVVADSTEVKVGDSVVAIGNPFNLDRTLTSGVVSALQREIRAQNNFKIDDVIQTDAAVNPGNSGGPLLNMRGEVIGVNSQIESRSGGNDSIAFAVPSNTVKRVVDDLVESGKVEYEWLGVTGTDIDKTVADIVSLPTDEGVLVADVVDGSPADEAGLEGGDQEVTINGYTYPLGGDVIVKFDGKKVETMRELADLVGEHKPGEKVEIIYYRGKSKKSVDVKLATRDNETGSVESRQ